MGSTAGNLDFGFPYNNNNLKKLNIHLKYYKIVIISPNVMHKSKYKLKYQIKYKI